MAGDEFVNRAAERGGAPARRRQARAIQEPRAAAAGPGIPLLDLGSGRPAAWSQYAARSSAGVGSSRIVATDSVDGCHSRRRFRAGRLPRTRGSGAGSAVRRAPNKLNLDIVPDMAPNWQKRRHDSVDQTAIDCIWGVGVWKFADPVLRAVRRFALEIVSRSGVRSDPIQGCPQPLRRVVDEKQKASRTRSLRSNLLAGAAFRRCKFR